MGSKTEREWWVKVNIDDLCHDLDRLESTEERGQWLEGFRVGSRGHEPRDTWGAAKMLGHAFGMTCHDEAVIYRDKKVIAGQISADNRREKNGTAQPMRMIHAEHNQNSVRTALEVCSEHNPEQTLEHAPNQPTTNNQQPATSNEKQTTKNNPPLNPPRGKSVQIAFSARMFDALMPIDLASHHKFPEAWGEWLLDRKARRKPVTERAAKQQLASLQEMGADDAVQSIVQSIAYGWQGLFPPKTKAPANYPGSQSSVRQMTEAQQMRLKGLQIKKEAAERTLRIARNYPSEHDVDDAKRKLDAIRADILAMGVDPDQKGQP